MQTSHFHKTGFYTRRSFIIGIIVLALLLTALVTWLFDKTKNEYFSYFLIGLPLLIAGTISTSGLGNIFRTRKEKKNFQWYFGLIVNSSVAITVLVIIAINFIEIAKLFSLI